MPVRSRSKPPKLEALREEGTLNPTPDEVHDPKFQENEFFDPHDIVQVKYEMLRRVSAENASVSAATEEYGVSRPTYYQTKASFDKGGVAREPYINGCRRNDGVVLEHLAGEQLRFESRLGDDAGFA